jgi:tetratricopeptide (TPR) repeat protein
MGTARFSLCGARQIIARMAVFLAAFALFTALSVSESAADGFDDARTASEAEAVGEHGKALFLYGRAIESGELDPISQANTHYNRGSLYAKLDNLVGAANDFTRAVQLRPDFALGHRSLAVVHAFAGRDIKALAAFGRALHLNPEDAIAFNDRGTIYYKLGQLDEAVFDFTQALRLEPAYATAYYNRAAAWEELGVLERAADDYRALLIIDPNDDVARADLQRLALDP